MTLRHRLAYYLRVAARYLEDPAQLRMRRYYFIPSLYGAFSQRWLQTLKFATVLDIGANVGDFAFTIRPLLPDAQIYSFEPLPDCYQQMLEHLKGVTKFKAFNVALGEQSGELEFQRSSHSPSSSFLKMAEAHKTAFPASAGNQVAKVRVERLDDCAAQLALVEPLLVKIDVQGYEGHVLHGGQQTIRRAAAIVVETSFEPLYEGQPLFPDVYRTLTEWGFTYLGRLDQFCDPHDNRPLQQDSLFVKR
ncbi:2-O-methyltransferase NoeI [Thermoflexales bacterium]|nr:2-O-methyltransferase NoeI [Thermoflexales bacterium]